MSRFTRPDDAHGAFRHGRISVVGRVTADVVDRRHESRRDGVHVARAEEQEVMVDDQDPTTRGAGRSY
jgi:hypothetical protein